MTHLQQIPIALDPTTVTGLDSLAALKGQSRQDIIGEALSGYVAHEAWCKEQVRVALDEVTAGKGIAHSKVITMLQDMGIDLGDADQ